MSSISESQYLEMLARTERNAGRLPQPADPVSSESDLHDEIIQLCKRRGWFYVHSRMDKRTTQAVGVPDFIIAADGGRTFWIECKAKGNKPTNEQLATITFLKAKGHAAAICYNMADVMVFVVTGQEPHQIRHREQLDPAEQPQRLD